MRRQIAEHMLRSRRTAAHVTTFAEVDMSRVVARRAALKERFAARGVPLTYLAFVARATVAALQEQPVLNASIDGDDLVYHDDVNLGIAVALEDGLIVPVIRQAQRLSLEGIAAAIGDLSDARASEAARARGRPGRHLHDHEPRAVRHDARDADHQPAAGRDPRPGGGREAAGRGRGRRRATRSRSGRWSTCACRSTTAPWTAPKRPGSWVP